MIGLPYPNVKSPELMEKMEYLNTTQVKDKIKPFILTTFSTLSPPHRSPPPLPPPPPSPSPPLLFTVF